MSVSVQKNEHVNQEEGKFVLDVDAGESKDITLINRVKNCLKIIIRLKQYFPYCMP